MKTKHYLLLAAFGLMATATLTSCEDILGHWEKPTPASESEAIPGPLAGKFTINASGDQVQFAQGNLQAKTTNSGASWTWAFAEHQWDCIGDAAGNNNVNADGTLTTTTGTVDMFCWVGSTSSFTGAAKYGIINVVTSGYGTKTGNQGEVLNDWGTNMGAGWRTLTKDEWTYLFNGRTSVTTRYCKATVNSKSGVVLFPDIYTQPDGVTAPASANTADAAFSTNTWSSDDWSKMETAGCVFLPAAGYRHDGSVSYVGSEGFYWSSSPHEGMASQAYIVNFNTGLTLGNSYYRYSAASVRLVRAAE